MAARLLASTLAQRAKIGKVPPSTSSATELENPTYRANVSHQVAWQQNPHGPGKAPVPSAAHPLFLVGATLHVSVPACSCSQGHESDSCLPILAYTTSVYLEIISLSATGSLSYRLLFFIFFLVPHPFLDPSLVALLPLLVTSSGFIIV